MGGRLFAAGSDRLRRFSSDCRGPHRLFDASALQSGDIILATMRRIVLTLSIALVVTAGLLVTLTPESFGIHAERCASVTYVGDFCVSWNDRTGFYNLPPEGVPADFSRASPTATFAELFQFGLVIFLVLAGPVWLLLGLAARLRAGRRGGALGDTPKRQR
jgi:hypothetical protein